MTAFSDDITGYEGIAREIRLKILDLIYRTKSPHIGSSFSIVEILVSLYFKYLHLSPASAEDPQRNRFILSKGHACPAFFAVLHRKGFLSDEELQGFALNGGTLEQHPSLDIRRGIEVTSGSLGHGLSIGTGMALAGRTDGRKYKTYVLMSDGEMNEGSVWEAVMFAAHHKLSNLVALVDRNSLQALGFTRDIIDLAPLADKWGAFGWFVQVVNGHDFQEIFTALDSLDPEKPNTIILETIKGRGVSFMENHVLWHYRAPDDQEYERALEELRG